MNKRKKLIWQLFPSFLLITLLSLLAVSWYASSSLHHFFLDQTAADLRIRALLVEKQIVAHLAPLDAAEVDAICKEFGKQSATRITVILPSGQVIGDSRETPHLMDNHADRPEIGMALKGNHGQSTRFSNTGPFSTAPLERGGRRPGCVLVRWRLHCMTKRTQFRRIRCTLRLRSG